MFKFNRTYFLLAILFLAVEIFIALFIPEGFIRHSVGDILVVLLIYCSLNSFLKLPLLPLAFGVLLFAYSIEILQYFEFLNLLGLSKNRLLSVVLGNTFDWMDMVMYTVGILIILGAEQLVGKMKIKPQTSNLKET